MFYVAIHFSEKDSIENSNLNKTRTDYVKKKYHRYVKGIPRHALSWRSLKKDSIDNTKHLCVKRIQVFQMKSRVTFIKQGKIYHGIKKIIFSVPTFIKVYEW